MNSKVVIVRGSVISGIGVGHKYVSIPYYKNLLSSLLDGEEPYPGTLNIRVNLTYKELSNLCKPNEVPSKVIEGKRYGGFIYWKGKIKTVPSIGSSKQVIVPKVLILRPHLSRHEDNVLEIVSHEHLRSKLSLRDGDTLEIVIMCK